MLCIHHAIPYVYELSLTGDSIIDENSIKNTYREVLNNPVDVLLKNTKFLDSLDLNNNHANLNNELDDELVITEAPGLFSISRKRKNNIPNIEMKDIDNALIHIDSVIKNKLKTNPLLLINECMSKFCPLTRTINKTIRNSIEIALKSSINRATSICFVGVGGMFQELVLLSNKPKSKLYLFIIDDLKDYISTLHSGDDRFRDDILVNPLHYYGNIDRDALDRVRWSYIKTMRYISFLQWFKTLGYDITFILCANANSYQNAMMYYVEEARPNLVIGIDLIDDNAERQLISFYSAALSTLSRSLDNSDDSDEHKNYGNVPEYSLNDSKRYRIYPRCINISNNYIHIFDLLKDMKWDENYNITNLKYDNPDKHKKSLQSGYMNFPTYFANCNMGCMNGNIDCNTYDSLDDLLYTTKLHAKTLLKYEKPSLALYVLNLAKAMYILGDDKRKYIIKKNVTILLLGIVFIVVLVSYLIYRLLF